MFKLTEKQKDILDDVFFWMSIIVRFIWMALSHMPFVATWGITVLLYFMKKWFTICFRYFDLIIKHIELIHDVLKSLIAILWNDVWTKGKKRK